MFSRLKNVRWPWQRWKRFELTVDGYHFTAWANPVRSDVNWDDCPSRYLPGGFGSWRFMMLPDSMNKFQVWWSMRTLPGPTEESVREEIHEWLEDLREDDEYADEFT